MNKQFRSVQRAMKRGHLRVATRKVPERVGISGEIRIVDQAYLQRRTSRGSWVYYSAA